MAYVEGDADPWDFDALMDNRGVMRASVLGSSVAGKGAGRVGIKAALMAGIAPATLESFLDQAVRGLSRSTFVALVAAGYAPANGASFVADGLSYLRTGALLIPDLPGWVPGAASNTRHFGATTAGDSTTAMEAAVKSGLPLWHDIYCNVGKRLEQFGPLTILGTGKGNCGINWTQGGADEGLKVTRATWLDIVHVEGLDLMPSGAGKAICLEIDNDPIKGTTVGRSYFDVRTRVRGNRMGRGTGLAYGWKQGLVCRFPFANEVYDNEIYGYASATAVLPADFVEGSVGILVPDQTTRTLANFQIYRNVVMGFRDGSIVYNVEGCNAEQNDYQVCHDGLTLWNSTTKVNQYRVRFNHFGVSGCQFRLVNARQLLFVGNEVSYRYGRTDRAVVPLIELDAVYSFNIIGNSVRGNVTTDDDVLVDGIKLMTVHPANAADYTRKGVIAGNSFQNLRDEITIPVETGSAQARAVQIYGNVSDGRRGKRIRNPVPGLIETMRVGIGDFDLTGITTTSMHVANMGGPAIVVDRQGADGGTIIMQRDGGTVGTIATTSTSTAYNTTSDARLKQDQRLLTADEARDILSRVRIHVYQWLSTGGQDIGAFAQELNEVYPAAVTPGVGEPGEDEFIPWSVDYSKLMPLVIAALF